MGYPAGYGIAVVSYVQMAVICDAGQGVIERVGNCFDDYARPSRYIDFDISQISE